MKENIRKAEIKFVGDFGWKKFRDLLVLKMCECQNEEDFAECLEMLLASMFRDEKEIDKYRKEARIKLLDEHEKAQIRSWNE